MSSRSRTCLVCGRAFPATRGRRYCSRAWWPSRRPYAPDSVPEPTGDRREVLALLWEAARKGSVTAAALLLKEMKAEPPTRPKSVIDELVGRRQKL